MNRLADTVLQVISVEPRSEWSDGKPSGARPSATHLTQIDSIVTHKSQSLNTFYIMVDD